MGAGYARLPYRTFHMELDGSILHLLLLLLLLLLPYCLMQACYI